MGIPQVDEIIEPNDQTEARRASLGAFGLVVRNVYPNKFVRAQVSGKVDTITNLKAFDAVADIVDEMQTWKSEHEGERPPAEFKDGLNARLKEFGNVRIAGRLTTPPRAHFVHLTDGMNKLQIYAKTGMLSLL